MPLNASSRKYLKEFLNPVKQAINEAASKSAVDIFIKAVSLTVVDSGRAANNWSIGERQTFDWTLNAVPVGESGSSFDQRASNLSAVMNSKMDEAALFESTYKGGDIVISNPTPDGEYTINALGQVSSLFTNSESVFNVGEAFVRSKYSGMFY